MSHQRWHTWEKAQVEIASVLGLAVMYLLAGSVLRTYDPDRAVVFLPKMELARMAIFVLVVWGLAALCAVLTTSARPEGALLATLVGAGGVSLRSESLTGMVQTYERHLPDLLAPLAIELCLMVPVILVAWIIIRLVRHGIGHVRPGWVRPVSLHTAGNDTRQAVTAGWPPRLPAPERLVSAAAAFIVTLLIGLVLTMLLMFSDLRGQILFGLGLAFFVGAGVASYFFPVRTSAPCWLAAVALGIVLYLKAAWGVSGGFQAWTQLRPWAFALPVDWLAAGCGGAVGGFWLACRIRDAAHMPKPAETPLEE